MKKLFATVLAVLSAAACVGALAACGETEEEPPKNQTVDENTDPKNLVSEKLSEAEFSAAITPATFDNVVFYQKSGEQGWMRMTYAGTKRKMETNFGEDGLHVAYASKEGDAYYSIESEDGQTYKKQKIEKAVWDDISFGSENVQGFVYTMRYQDLSWDDSVNGYLYNFSVGTVSEGAEAQTQKVILKFVDKKLAGFYVQGADSTQYKSLFYNYGTASVSLPEAELVGGSGGSGGSGDTGNAGGAVDEDTDAAAYVSEKITAESLLSAQSDAAFTNVTMLYVNTVDDVVMRIAYDGDKRKYESTEDGVEEFYYLGKQESEYYVYQERGNFYEKVETDARVWSDLTLSEGYMLGFFANLKFTDLEWSESEKGYLYTDTDSKETAVLKFSDGKLALYYPQGAGDKMKAVLYGYGETTVTLPEDKVIDNVDPATLTSEQVTEEEWAAAFAEASFQNASLYMSMTEKEGSDVVSELVMRMAQEQNKRYMLQTITGQESDIGYMEKDGDKYYTYTQSTASGSQGWVKNELTYQEVYDHQSIYFLVNQYESHFKSPVWNGKDGYLCATDQNGVEFTVKFINKKVAAIYGSMEDGGTSQDVVMLLYGYGVSTVTLPKVSDSSTGGEGGGDTPSHPHVDNDGDKLCDKCGMAIGGGDAPSHNHNDLNGDGVCDECKEPIGESGGGDVPQHGHNDLNGDGLCDECGERFVAEQINPDFDPAGLTSEQIALQEWNKIIDRGLFGNFTYFSRVDGKDYIIEYDDFNIRVNGYDSLWLGRDGDAYCKYIYGESGLEKQAIENAEYQQWSVDVQLEWLFNLDASNAVWSEENGGYLVNTAGGESYVFIFKENKLNWCYVLGESQTKKWQFTNYNFTHVEPPFLPLTKAEWDEAFSDRNATNVVVIIRDENGHTEASYCGNVAKIVREMEGEKYYKTEGGKSYSYDEATKTWTEGAGYVNYLSEFSTMHPGFSSENETIVWDGDRCDLTTEEGNFIVYFDREKRVVQIELLKKTGETVIYDFNNYGNVKIELI